MNLAPTQKPTNEKIKSKGVLEMSDQIYHDPASATSATPSTAYGTAGTSKPVTTHKYFVSLYNFKGEDETFLSFSAGEKITLTEQSSNGWWKGTLLVSGSRMTEGYFPSEYVMHIDRDDHVLKVLYDFTGGREDEISVLEDDIVVLVENKGQWCEVKSPNGQGLVPTSYVITLEL